MPPVKAKWAAGKPTVTTAADGTFTVGIPLLDGGTKVADVTVTITADRVFQTIFEAVQGLGPDQTIRSFEAWSNV